MTASVVAMAGTIGGWLLTYLVHSTLLLGGVALLTRRVVKRETTRETLWKAALVGGLVTASVAVALPRATAAEIELAALGVGSPMASADAAWSSDGPASSNTDTDVNVDVGADSEVAVDTRIEADVDVEGDTGELTVEMAGGAAGGSGDSGGSVTDTPPGFAGAGPVVGGPASWLLAALLTWAVIAAVLLGRLGYRHARLRWLLRGRQQMPGSEAAAVMLTELRRTAGVWKPVRLTTTPMVATPVALGGVEVCVPERFLSELGTNEQRAALAHELAHLARRDPAWQLLGSLVGAVFFFQPLNHVGRRAIRSAAEYLADGWAVSQTGSTVELARCLAAVAGWVAPSEEPMLAGTVAMAEGGSPLLARVQRLLEHEPETPVRPGLRVAGAIGLLAGVAGFAPALGPASPATEPSPETVEERVSEPEVRQAAVPVVDEVPVPDGVVQESLDVRRLDGPRMAGESFVARLNAAGRDAGQTPYWVAYTIRGHDASLEQIVTDSEPWASRSLKGRPLVERLGVAEALAAGPGRLLVLVRLVPEEAGTRLDRLTVRRPELGMPIDGRVYWLGDAGEEESFRWLREIQVPVWEEDIREAAVEAIGLHATPSVDPFLRRVLKNDPSTDVKEEAIEGLALRRQDPELARLFFDLAMRDPDGGVRQEATENLARIGQPERAAELLERLANDAPDRDIQRQAAESLGEVGTPAAEAALRRVLEEHKDDGVREEALDQLARTGALSSGDALLRLALTAGSPDLRREAVEALERLGVAAVPYLRRAVFESGDGTVEREATEVLGQIGNDAALEVLRDILRLSPGEDAAFQAVESIAENYPRRVAIAVLRELALTHDSSRVRREAVDVLGDLGG